MEVPLGNTQSGSEKKLFTGKAISVAAVFGGPVAAAFLFSKNYKTLGMHEAARKSLFFGIAGLVAFFAILFALPQRLVDAIPNAAFAGIWGGLAYALVHEYQQEHIETHLAEGGKKGSGWTVFGSTILGIILTLIIFVPFALLAPPFDGKAVTLEATGGVVYYEGDITQVQVQTLGRLLEEIEYFSPGDEGRAAKLEESEGQFNVILEIDKQFWEDLSSAELFDALIIDLERHFGASVQITAISYRLDGKKDEKVFTKLSPVEDT